MVVMPCSLREELTDPDEFYAQDLIGSHVFDYVRSICKWQQKKQEQRRGKGPSCSFMRSSFVTAACFVSPRPRQSGYKRPPPMLHYSIG